MTGRFFQPVKPTRKWPRYFSQHVPRMRILTKIPKQCSLWYTFTPQFIASKQFFGNPSIGETAAVKIVAPNPHSVKAQQNSHGRVHRKFTAHGRVSCVLYCGKLLRYGLSNKLSSA